MAKDVISAARAAALLNSHGGPALLLTARTNVGFPEDIDDIITFDQGETQFEPVTGWTSFGLTKGGLNISRGFDKIERDADQSYGAYDFRISGWSTMVTTETVETSPYALSQAWVGSTPENLSTMAMTKLDSAAARTSTSLTVSAGTGEDFTAGDIVIVGTGTNQEFVKVASVAEDVITVGALLYSHAANETVIRPSKERVTFGTARNVNDQLLAVVAPVDYQHPQLGGVWNGMRAWVFRRTKLDAGQRQIQLSNQADWTIPLAFYAFPDLTQSDPDSDTFVMYDWSFVPVENP